MKVRIGVRHPFPYGTLWHVIMVEFKTFERSITTLLATLLDKMELQAMVQSIATTFQGGWQCESLEINNGAAAHAYLELLVAAPATATTHFPQAVTAVSNLCIIPVQELKLLLQKDRH